MSRARASLVIAAALVACDPSCAGNVSDSADAAYDGAVDASVGDAGLGDAGRDAGPVERPDASFPLLPVEQALYPDLLLRPTSFFWPSTTFLEGKKVFAHFMVCCSSFQSFNGGVAGAKQEILMAQSMGIDGFALNVGAWSAEPGYPLQAANFFEAAKQLGTNFSLFFSADLCCSVTPADIRDMMTRFGRHPNYTRVNGRPVLSTFSGGAHRSADVAWWRDQVLTPLASAGLPLFFEPFFYTDPVSEVPSADLVRSNVAFWRDTADGFFYFGAAGTPFGTPSLVTANADYAAEAHDAGRHVMASYTPFYWGNVQTTNQRRYYEFEGGRGTEAQWRGLLGSSADWVQLVTWNDLNESYVSPIDDFQKYSNWGAPLGWYQSHAGYAELNRYYIQWFKTGVQPRLRTDAVFAFYRTHSKDLVASADPKGPVAGWSPNLADDLYLSIWLVPPTSATLKVRSGGVESTHALGAELTHLSVPFHAGPQHFELWRDGQLALSLDGAAIDSRITLYNYWPATAFVEGP